eukprot:1038520-Prymnesium_polylepis.1
MQGGVGRCRPDCEGPLPPPVVRVAVGVVRSCSFCPILRAESPRDEATATLRVWRQVAKVGPRRPSIVIVTLY